MMRDLQKDWNVLYGIIDWIAIPKQQIVKEWLERAIKAEAEVERLTEINQGCEQEAHLYDDLLRRCRAENAKLRKVVDAAREDLAIVCTSGETCAVCQNVENRGDNFPCRVSDGWCCGDKWVWRGEQALAELDKEGGK